MYFYRAAVYITYESRTVIDEYTGRVAAWHHTPLSLCANEVLDGISIIMTR